MLPFWYFHWPGPSVSRNFLSRFFHDSNPSGPVLKYFRIWYRNSQRYSRVQQTPRCHWRRGVNLRGVIDTVKSNMLDQHMQRLFTFSRNCWHFFSWFWLNLTQDSWAKRFLCWGPRLWSYFCYIIKKIALTLRCLWHSGVGANFYHDLWKLLKL